MAVNKDTAALVLKALVLVLLGSAGGFGYNLLARDGIYYHGDEDGLLVGLEYARKAFDEGSAVFVDSRSTWAYEEGHVPGAVSLPLEEFDDLAGSRLGDVPVYREIITYCSGTECQSSLSLARKLTEEMGFMRTRAFFQGWPAWVEAGQPVAVVEPEEEP